ncbi:MAG: response regulator [Flavobacteriaceae bacterium]
MTQLTPKIIVVDSDHILRPAYEAYFETYLDYSLKGIFNSVKEALASYDQTRPAIIFLEANLPDMCGIEGIQHFRSMDPMVKIIIISTPNDFELVKKAFKNGANGYLTKPVSQRTIYNALYAIECQGAFISNDLAQKVIAMFQKKSYQLFSERENEVVDLLRQGETYKTIAEKLFVTASAVNFHVQNIYLKLNVNSKSEALVKLHEMEKSAENLF